MSDPDDPLSVPPGARATLWLFAIDLPEAELDAFLTKRTAEDGPDRWPVAEALGTGPLDPDHVAHFDTADIREIGLASYLTGANGMDEASVAPDRARLDAQTGHVLIVSDRALPGRDSRLDPRPPLRLIGRYSEGLDFSVRAAPVSAAAHGPVEDAPRKAPSQGAMSGRVAMVALLVLFALVGLMIWVAG